MAVDIPAAKRAGLPVDLGRLTAEGDDWLSAEERYALKMHGVCAQAQPGVFMIRVRTGGSVEAQAAGHLADIAAEYGQGWIHVTTRQQVELHHVEAKSVTAVLEAIARTGLTTRSSCGHTMRGVMSCPDAGAGLDEPFDCRPDARAAAESILARTPELDCRMPQRINITFGGCPACREHALVNDIAFVSRVAEDETLGYELWLGGSLGKSSPALSIKASDFIRRDQVLPALNAAFDLFIEHGDIDNPARGRLKFLIRRMGEEEFLRAYRDAFARSLGRNWPEPEPVSRPLTSSVAGILARAPEGGWGSGVRPQRMEGWAMVTVNVPLGDLDAADMRLLAGLSSEFADGHLHFTRNQNVMFRFVRLESVPALRRRLDAANLGLEGSDQSRDLRACTGGPVCTLALTPVQKIAADLAEHPALLRNSGLRVHISGCPNACAQHQIADIGLSGGKVTIHGVPMLGYHVWLGGDLRAGRIASIVGRVAEADVPAIVSAVAGVWEALRERGETLSDTVERFGLEAWQAQIGAVFNGRWEPGAEPGGEATGGGAAVDGRGAAGEALPVLSAT